MSKMMIPAYAINSLNLNWDYSDYVIENIKENGILKGSINGFKRILSCHPIKILGGGEGFDPVKKKK